MLEGRLALQGSCTELAPSLSGLVEEKAVVEVVGPSAFCVCTGRLRLLRTVVAEAGSSAYVVHKHHHRLSRQESLLGALVGHR